MIEAYPFFLQKDSQPFRFEIIENVSHEIVNFSARAEDELFIEQLTQSLEELKREGKKCLIQIHFGLEEGFEFDNQMKFSGYVLALEELNKNIIQQYKNVIDGLIFYRGTAFLENSFSLSDDNQVFDHIDVKLSGLFDQKSLKRLAAATCLGTIFHRLISFIDDDVPCFCIFLDAEKLRPLERAILFSKQRFEHVFLVFSNPEFQSTNLDLSQGLSALGYIGVTSHRSPPPVDTGLLLPEDDKLSQVVIDKLQNFMASDLGYYRVISEKIFNECWNDIQKVYYDPISIHPMTLRMIKGFEASGGEAFEI